MKRLEPLTTCTPKETTIRHLRGASVGIVGGGQFCHKLLHFFNELDLSPIKPRIVGVIDINPNADGYRYAQQCGLTTAARFEALYKIEDLQIILEITNDPELAAAIQRTKPPQVELIDHFHARYLWDAIQVENLQLQILDQFNAKRGDAEALEALFQKSFDCFIEIISRRNKRSRQKELALLEIQRTQSQIIQGSTIPTFVINSDHIVTHWNRALEKMSGAPAEQVVGTNRQWAPFWQRERPTMADVILDQIDEDEIQKLYGSQWRKSGLIDGAYEAEVFFPQVGENGKWLWFTAAPLKAPDGTIVGAIETLWDKSEDKIAEQERERRASELGALCSIYTALSAPWEVDHRIQAALKEIQHFFMVEDISIFLHDSKEKFYLKYHYGPPRLEQKPLPSDNPLINEVARTGESRLIEKVDPEQAPFLAELAGKGFLSIAYIPISAKEKKSLGVLQIASRSPKQYDEDERHVLELIGNRIGAALENAMLQEQYIKSEKKYRSLFDNDPNPIFIIDHHSLDILDINERAKECYGYDRSELNGMPFMQLGDPTDVEVQKGMTQLAVGQSILFSKRRHFRKDGHPFYVNINASHAHYGEGHVLIATTTDITETVEKETQLVQASKMTTLGLMAAGMAHEINQPLNVIQICADYFLKMVNREQPIPPEDLRNMANDITANVTRATGIIRHVRDFARQSEVEKNRIRINDPIRDVFKVMGHQIKVHQIELDLDLDDDIPFVMADHNRLEQVFINLVTNAIDAMDEKAEQTEHKDMTKRLFIGTRTEKGKVVVTVRDNGVGMSEEVKNKLFEPFFTTKKVGKGTGLGVSISYGIIKDYEGTIEIQSKKGEGTAFVLTFPIYIDASKPTHS